MAILFAVFISLFALDVFGQGYGFLETIIALIMHLLPTFLIILMLLIAWKFEIIGGLMFILLGLIYISKSYGEAEFLALLIMAGPLLLIGILFIICRFSRKKELLTLYKIFRKKGGEKMAKKRKKAAKKTTKKKAKKRKKKR